ncbi:MAG TPA: TolC family protein [Tepidisphaeraceae bacterium]|jgi:outer membrane protein TolC|nr:TolC family protein [Tepidisphaeraceae bacterium]
MNQTSSTHVTRASRSRVLYTSASCILSSIFIFAGCKVDQSAEVAIYRKVLHASTSTAPARPLPATQPLSLRRALVLANNHNESLSIQGETYLQALIAQRRLVESFFTPTVSGNVGTGLSGNGHKSNTFSFNNRTDNNLQASLTEQVNLFNGFQDVNAIDRNKYLADQNRWELLDLQNSILLDVANQYYAVLISEASVDVLRDTVSLDDYQIHLLKSQYQVGTAKPLDISQSEAVAANTRVQLNRAINDVQNGRAALATFIAVPDVKGPLSDDLPEPAESYDLDALTRDALDTRQDLQAASSAIDAAYKNVKIAVGEYWPTIGISLTENVYRDPASFGNWAASLPISIPIFTAGAIHQDVRLAWSQFRQSALSRSQTQRQVIQDVRTAYYNITSSAIRLRDIQYEVTAAKNAYDLSVTSYRVGNATNLDVLTAQNQLLTARLDQVTEQLNHKLYYLQLLRSQGRLTIPAIPATQPNRLPATHPTSFPTAH